MANVKPDDASEQTARDLDAFVYAVSHDMSAPIRAVSGFSRLILDRTGDNFDIKTREQFDYIIRAGEEMQAMLTALTEYSRLSTRPNPPAETAVAELMGMVVEGFAERIRETNASIEMDIEDTLTLYGDIPRLMRLFECLLDNALLYRDPDRPLKIQILGWRDEKCLHLSVADNGIGMSPSNELRERIFRPFGRLHRPEDYPGIGMGLTLAKKIAGLHNGTLDFDSTPGAGSQFFLTLPSPPAS